MNKTIKKYDLIVLGAGVSGLACADEVLRNTRNKNVLVIEKNSYVGGLAATIRQNGYNYDLAPHRWFTKNEELNKWINDLMGSELIWVDKYTPMYQFGRFFKYPIKISDILTKINPFMALVMLFAYFFEKIKAVFFPRKIVSMKDAYLSRFGWGLYKWFNKEYNEKLWGEGGSESMSADFVSQRVKNLSMTTALLNAIGMNKNKVISLVEKFRFPRMGIGRISERLAERISLNKGEIKLSENVIKIWKKGALYYVETNKNTYSTTRIISSIPVNIFLNCFDDAKKIKKHIDQLQYINQKVVVLFAKGKKLTNFTWVYVHPKKIKTFRFVETNNWSKEMSPKNRTTLIFEYPYHPNDDLDKMSDEDLIKLTINDFVNFFASKKVIKNILDGKVYYVPFAYPKYDFNYSDAMKHIYKYIDNNLLGIQLIGRNGMFHYNNLDHSIFIGILAGRNYLNKKSIYDLKKVNNEAEYLEEIKKN